MSIFTASPASVLWCEVTPDTVSLEVRFTSTANGRDLSGVTGGRVYHLNAAGTPVFWPLTVFGTPTAHLAICRHAFTTGDLDATMIPDGLTMHALYSIAGTEYPDGPDPFLLPVVA